ncbi:sodium:solute symporter family transporter [Cardinium endosymbiont of Philonthus spinipes]|uniref:sodium:solute symporter family transporter n=1 Tax=Cardinium endosymbiont of Philonthus spinipes TaxID=3077941 RepID=UPI00313C25CE
MICLNIPLFIVAAFLVLTLWVGIYFSSKQTTFREYAVGNKQFSTATLVFTVLATAYGGGGLVRSIECIHSMGLWWVVMMLLSSFGLWVVGKLALRMGPFMYHLSIAETIGTIYGRYPRIIASLVGICGAIVIVTMQINVIVQAIGICVKVVNPDVMPILATLLLTFYSTFGGIRAVTFTDVLQFITFAIIIPLLAWFMFLKIGKPISEIFPILQSHAKFQFSHVFRFDVQLVGMLLLLLSLIASSILPQLMQRVYMSSGPLQAQEVFSYATLFSIAISIFIILIGLFAFVEAPALSKDTIWNHSMGNMSPLFKGLLAISLLGMAMSTADSSLNACAIMVGHDMVKGLCNEKKVTDAFQLKIARWTTLLVGLLAMMLAFYCNDLLQLLYLGLAACVPIVTAPFILAIFGFRGTARTALVGMATGVLVMWAWTKWIYPLTGIDGSFLAMIANGLAMMAVHYLLKQPKGVGWVEPDNAFKQMQQAQARKRAERQEAIKNAWANRKVTLAELRPSDGTLRLTGLYMIVTAILGYWFIKPDLLYWAICQGLLGTLFTSYGIFTRYKAFFSQASPNWLIGLCWLIGCAFYLPLNLLWYWWHLVDPIFNASLSLAHYTVILWVLPLYLGISVVVAVLLVVIYPIFVGLSLPVLSSLFPLFMVTLLVVAVIICFKVKAGHYMAQNLYLRSQDKIRASQKLKESLYDLAMVPSAALNPAKGHGAVLEQVIGKIEQSVSFLDGNMPLYKQDFQSIINKLYDWVAYFNRRAKVKDHALLQPTKITLDKLIRKVEFTLSQEVAHPPKLFVEHIKEPSEWLLPYIICDIHQVVYLLVQSILRVGKVEGSVPPVVRVKLQPTALQFKQADPIDGPYPVYMLFQATALVISQVTTVPEVLPKVQPIYDDMVSAVGLKGQQAAPPSIDLQQETISSIVEAHYGYCETTGGEQQASILLVLPNDVADILGKMTTKLPIDCLTLDAPVTPKEHADSMVELMQFHDHVAQFSHDMDPIDVGTISGLLLLLRQHFGFKRHASGQLFYVRAVGISKLVVEWVFHSPKVIYASLLYELVRHTCLPLSYVRDHYNLGVYAFVLNVLGIDQRESLDHPSLLYLENRLQKAVKEDHVQLSVLFIKLAERLYDLRHASGYIYVQEVIHMAQETLAIDVKLANRYLDPEIGAALEAAAKKALKLCKDKDKGRSKDKEQDS